MYQDLKVLKPQMKLLEWLILSVLIASFVGWNRLNRKLT